MRLKSLLFVTSFISLGCDAADSETQSAKPDHRRRLVDSIVEVAANPYPELDQFPKDQKAVRFMHAYNRDLHDVLRTFLGANPSEDAKLIALIRRWDEVVVQGLNFHERLLSENRFTYRETEEAIAEELQEESATLFGEVGRLIEH